jgi:hypothetical protein
MFVVQVWSRGCLRCILAEQTLPDLAVSHRVAFLEGGNTPETGARGGSVVEALRYKPEGRGIDSR